MALKNLFDMVKADRYTADGREAIIKAQEAETEDATRRTYQIGEISQATGLQKTANGWVKPKSGKQPGAATKRDTDPQTYIVKKNDELRSMFQKEKDPAKKAAMKKALQKQASMMEPEPFSSTESKPDESARIAASKEARAKKSQELGQKAAGDFAKYKDLPPVQRKDALGAASHEGISIGLTQRSMEGMGWDLIQADDKVNVYGKPDGSKAIMKHDGKKITEVNYEGPGNNPAGSKPSADWNETPSGRTNMIRTPEGTATVTWNKEANGEEWYGFSTVKNNKMNSSDTHYKTKAEAQLAAEKELKGENEPAGRNFRSELEANPKGAYDFEKTIEHSIPLSAGDKEILGRVKSFMQEESTDYKNALKSVATGLVNGNKLRGDWYPEKEKSLLKIAKAVGMDNEVKSYVKTLAKGYDFGYSEDSAPRVLTGDCRIRIRKEKPALTGDTKIRVRK